MIEEQEIRYRARMAVAQLFLSFLDQSNGRALFLRRLGVEDMPVIVPALGDTLAFHISETIQRYFDEGEEHVVVPVCFKRGNYDEIALNILIVSTYEARTFWQLDMSELHDSVSMREVVEALDSEKKWDISELDSDYQKELKNLVCLGERN